MKLQKSYMHMYFGLTGTVEILQQTKSKLFDMCIFSQHSPFRSLTSEGGWKRKGTMVCPTFPGPSMSSYMVGQERELTCVRKNEIQILCPSCFLKTTLPFLLHRSKLFSNEKSASHNRQHPHVRSSGHSRWTLHSY